MEGRCKDRVITAFWFMGSTYSGVGCDPQKLDDACREVEETLGLNAGQKR